MRKHSCVAVALWWMGLSLLAQDSPTLFRSPALSRTHIVFEYAGDLWIVEREGGTARRLTTAPGLESGPTFSPDGRWVAYSGESDGNVDVYVIAASGGVPRRLTWHPGADEALGWTSDGRRILFRSPRHSFSRFRRLFTLPLEGAFPEEIPLVMAEEGSFSPDGQRIAYVPLARAFHTWKRYRGGRTTPIWIARLADSEIVDRIPRENSNDFCPMWIGERIYFLSDRSGSVTLFYYDTRSRRVVQALPPGDFDVKHAAAGPDAIVYEQFGSIHLFDWKTQRSRRVPIRLSGDRPEVRPRLERVAGSIRSASISPSGARAVFEARGEIFTVPAEKGDCRNLTQTPGAAERDPAWSPDGRWIAYFSDATGEYQLEVRDHLGKGEVKRYRLSERPTYYYSPVWSPDSKKIAYTDKALNVWYLDVESGRVVHVDRDRYDGPRRVRHLAWSPDSQWLTYTLQLRNHLRAVFVYSLRTATKIQITDGMSDATLPVFDRDGKHLYFLASTDTGLNIGWRDMSSYFRPVTSSVYVLVLTQELPNPLAPESDEEKAAPPAPARSPSPAEEKTTPEVRIDPEGMEQRILALPIPARNYTGVAAGRPGVLFLLETPFRAESAVSEQRAGRTLYRFDLKTRKTDRVLEGVAAFALSWNGEKMLYRQGDRWAITSAGGAVKPGEGILRVEGMEARIEPEAEWRQMYREAWRIQRDFFYDPHLHGLDLEATMKRYEPFLSAVSSRWDLEHLFAEMMGELTASHLNVSLSGPHDGRRVSVGLLGADYRIENGRYRFARVYTGESWNPDLRAPLTPPGVNVRAGEYLLAVNGRELRADDNLYSFFEGAAGKQVRLRVGSDPSGAGAREVTVVPLESEMRLRQLAWIEENRRKVDQWSGGRLAYVYLPDTALGGYTSFNRYFFAQVGKQGAILDERFNAGGSQPDYILDYLRRPLLHYRTMREGEDITGPLGGIFGPKVMLINEYAGSGGDTMPWYFRKAGLGPLIGKRTWGGLVGGLGGYPTLIDGGIVTPPAVGFWDPDRGEWVAENVGIAPDIEVEWDPKAARQGRDPQLEKAVEVLLEMLRKNPPREAKRPPFPNYHQGRTP